MDLKDAVLGCGLLLMFITFALGVIFFLVVLPAHLDQRRRGEILAAVAPYGGRAVKAESVWQTDLTAMPHDVELQIEGCPANLAFLEPLSGRRRNRSETSLTVDTAVLGQVSARWIGMVDNAVVRVLGAEDISVGDEAFDRRFRVTGDSVEKAREVLAPAVRQALMRLQAYEPSLELEGGDLHLTVPHYLPYQPGGVAAFLAAGRQIVASLEATVRERHLPTGPSVVPCVVCGRDAYIRTVRCETCGARQHRDCWNATGHCGVAECGGRQFV